MTKRRIGKLLLTSLVILLPMLIGIIFWEQLPEQMISHWNANGEAEGQAAKELVVYGLPLLLLAAHWVCIFATLRDPGSREQNSRVFSMVLWLIPIASLFANGLMYYTALGREINAAFLGLLLMGLLFVILGNYLPKCRQNAAIGIRIKWTLESTENWHATHRMAGRVYMAGGSLLILCAFLPASLRAWVSLLILLLLILLPILYSRWYAQRQQGGA